MVKCGKVKSFRGRPSKDGYVNMILLENIGEIRVNNKQYRDINIQDVVSLYKNENGEYRVSKIFKYIKNSKKYKTLNTKYQSIDIEK